MPVVAPLAVGGAIKGAQIIGAGIRQGKLKRQLRKMGDVTYSATPQLTSYYDRALQDVTAPRGIGAEALGSYNQQIANQTTANIRNAQKLGGGNISSQINAALNTANVDAATNLAAKDALIRNQNRISAYGRLGSATQSLQGIGDRNTGLKLEKLRALGTAARDARMTANNALGDLGNSAIAIGGMAAGGADFGFGKKGTTGITGTTSSQFTAPTISDPSKLNFNYGMPKVPNYFGKYGSTTSSGDMGEPVDLTVTQEDVQPFTPYRLNPFNPQRPPLYIN